MFNYKDVNINYQYIDNKSSITLVFLHGWGQNIAMMEPIAKPFANEYSTLIIDLPGFGNSEEPTYVWSLNDYAVMVNSLIKKLNINKVILIGHSFGGKISIIYASLFEVHKLVLIASPYKVAIKKLTFKQKLLKKMAKVSFLKGIATYFKLKIGSTDYKNATPMMRNILVKHVNTETAENCKKIKCPTIIIWGTDDKDVNISNAYEIEKLIPDSAVIEYPNKTHYAYLEDLYKTIEILKSFIK